MFVAVHSLVNFFFNNRGFKENKEGINALSHEMNDLNDTVKRNSKEMHTVNNELREQFNTMGSSLKGTYAEVGNMSDSLDNMWFMIRKLKDWIDSIKDNSSSTNSLQNMSPSTILKLDSSITDITSPNVISLNNGFSDGKFLKPPLKNKSPLMKAKEENKSTITASVGGKVFDLKTLEGKKKWYDFANKSAKKISNEKVGSNLCERVNKIDNKTESQEINQDNNHAKKTITLTLDQVRKIPTVDKNGKPFRRIFVPGFGWVSSKKLQADPHSFVTNKENISQ
ncbi:hypothetical protein DASC09_049220 [Saccharomycopsis crataegensis]|uniref:Uncharacterized protein n=1 Tax=Saccharomycopsis crataegensis TaxID=43959 RepID=A0AAV5QT66_9ASCO|nr:hypothetical protein DASC09_049220 [Saccharomycopsis crataegensis]